MTTVAVLADPPRSGSNLPALVDDVLTADEATDLYRAMVRDTCLAVARSGADLLVNYRADDQLDGDGESEARLRETLDPVLDTESVRFEVQVGSSQSARVGNTITHLLRDEGVRTAAITTPQSAFLARQHIDGAAMKLRQSPVVLGPAPDGRVTYAAFAEPIDFTAAFDSLALPTLADRARDADLNVDFIEMLPVLNRPADLPTALSMLRAKRDTGVAVPEHTADVVSRLGLTVSVKTDGPVVERS